MALFLREAEEFTTADKLPVLPLRDMVIFPHVVVPLLIGRAASLAALEEASKSDKFVLLVAQKAGEIQDPKADQMYRVGVVARILQLAHLPNGTVKILVEGIARAEIERFFSAKMLQAQVVPFPLVHSDSTIDEATVEATKRQAIQNFEEYVTLHRRIPNEVASLVQAVESDERRAIAVAAHLTVKPEIRQRLLEVPTLPRLWSEVLKVMGSEIELLRLEKKIDEDTRGSLVQNQREFYLHEQLRVINRELGTIEGDDLAELEAELNKRGLPPDARARADRELKRLRRMPPMSPETTILRNYLDWLASVPWSERTDDVLDVAHARTILDEDHYGLEEVKDRILDFIAVLGLVGRLDGPILCLVGPPGVGKTSLGRSVARALGRRFVRMALGGVRDEAEIRGHRRTYIGSMPGRIIQAMKRAEVTNPVILLDEVDKLGQDYRGDPAAALLEVLDPEQNNAFNDHFLEVDYDLSQVLFITTANSLTTIPDPLRDRMEVLRLTGYLDHEKLAIARQFLLPRQMEQNGLEPTDVKWHPDTLAAVMRGYTREAGVRELERRISRVVRKLARQRAEMTVADAVNTVQDVGPENLKELLGTAPYDPDDLTLEDTVGVARGLAYTSAGGETLEIEVSVVRGRGKVQMTGTLGDVMKESASAALSYARRRARELGIDREFYRTRDIHVHIPAGATPKDGPSAGIAIATAIISALTNTPVRADVAMTGEVTLRGRVLPIGGLKEKSVAASRNKIQHVIIPFSNARELDDVPAEVRDTVSFHPVKTMDEVLDIAFHPGFREHIAARIAPQSEIAH